MTLRDYIYDKRNIKALSNIGRSYKMILRQVFAYVYDFNVLTFDTIVRCYNMLEGEDKRYLSNNIGFSYRLLMGEHAKLLPSVKIEKNDIKFYAALSVEISRYYFLSSTENIYLKLRNLYLDIGENIYDNYLLYVEEYLEWIYKNKHDKDFKVQQRKQYIIEDISKF